MEQISVVNANERQKSVVQLQRWYIELFFNHHFTCDSNRIYVQVFRIEDALRYVKSISY